MEQLMLPNFPLGIKELFLITGDFSYTSYFIHSSPALKFSLSVDCEYACIQMIMSEKDLAQQGSLRWTV